MSAPRLPTATAVDLALLLALCATALAGLATTFTGSGFFVVGTTGLLGGAGLARLASALRWPFVAPVLLAVAAFFLLGGVLCLRSQGAVLPTPRTWGLLTDQVLFGWKDLLTTLPPLDGSGPLLVLPWAIGLASGVLGVLLAQVRSGPAWFVALLPLFAPLALLSAVILIGIDEPQSLWLQGVVFGGLALAWLGLRARRLSAPVRGQSGHASRLVAAGALVGLAGLLALPLGSWASGGDGTRLILREHVDPPFDIGQYASPLSSFRRYVQVEKSDPVNVYDKRLFTVEGVRPGTRVRFASLDSYDGVVWGAGNGRFQRVSSEIHNPVKGHEVEATVHLDEGYSGVWLPTVGALQSLRFTGNDTGAESETFRYNLATSTAVVPAGLRGGDSYTFTAVQPDDRLTPASAPSTLVSSAAQAAAFLDTQAVQWSAGESDAMKRVFAIADHLRREGKYSDGVAPAERIYHPGHHVHRLAEEFVNAPIMVGNDEQYAAVMALLVNKVGVPARVVMGAVVPEGGEVFGRDVSAWVEVQVADGSWRTLPTEAFMDFDKPAEQQPRTEQQLSGMMVPPPAPIPPPSTVGEQTDAELNAHLSRHNPSHDGGGWLPGWVRAVLVYAGLPLLVLAALAGSVVGAKALRRRRRRTHERVSARFVGGWRELVDHARDLGASIPSVGTRKEQAVLLPSGAPPLAREADAHVFGPRAPHEDAATAYWKAVDAERHSMSSAVPRARRWLAAVNLKTFFKR
jgi:hypothetical protein